MADLPRRLKILYRIRDLLKAIQGDGGENYFYTPHAVILRFADPTTLNGYPTYMIAGDSTPGRAEPASERITDERFIVSVKAWVDMEAGEPTSKLEKCLADVRKAIMNDQASGGPGSLNELCLACDLESLETDGGALSLDNLGYFDQRFSFLIPLEWGE